MPTRDAASGRKDMSCQATAVGSIKRNNTFFPNSRLPSVPHVDIECAARITVRASENLEFRVRNGLRIDMIWCRLRFGGDMTLFSYGITLTASEATPETIEEARIALRDALPRRHYRFLRRLRPAHSEGDYHFVHAGIRPSVPLDEQDQDDLLWIRDKFLKSKKHHGRVVVHGHSPVDQVDFRDNRIAIDTNAHASERLTALVLEGTSRRLLATAPPGAPAP